MTSRSSLSLAVTILFSIIATSEAILADDDPREAAEYRLLRERGGANARPQANPLGRAITRVQQLRAQISAAAAQPAARPRGMAIFTARDAGTATDYATIAGIPVGEIAGRPAPAPGRAAAPPAGVADVRAGMLELNLEPLPAATLSPLAAPATPGGITPSRWTWLGPGNIGGRTRSIVFHPTRPSTMWLGAVAGGIWKTIDSGRSWAPLADFMGSLNVSTTVLDPNNPDMIFSGTGEGFYNIDAFRGAGIFRSSDGGSTWQQLPGTARAEFYFVNRLVITADHNTLFAATRSGLYRSTNFRGTDVTSITFESVPALQGRDILTIVCSPSETKNCAAGGRGRTAYYSVDGGITWADSAGLPDSNPTDSLVGRVELTYAAADPNLVYASVDRNLGEIYRSTDRGKAFTLRSTGANYLSAQGWYGNAIWAGDPTRPGLLVVGGIDLYRSLDGGGTLTKISDWRLSPASAHADQHTITAHPGYNGTSNRTVYFGNDGGIYRNDDILTADAQKGWVALNNNYGVTQFYGGAGNTLSGRIVAGAQDNGTLVYSPPPGVNSGPNGWGAMYGGDGGFVAADRNDPNMMYGEYVYLQIHRSIDGGNRSVLINTGLEDAGQRTRALFIAPFILDPANPETMLAGGASLWKSPNVTAATPAWTAIKAPLAPSSDGRLPLISAIEARAANPGATASEVIWLGYTNGQVFRTQNGLAEQPAWQAVTTGAPPLPARFVTRIRIDPANRNTVYITFAGYEGGNLWRSDDGGSNWRNISGPLPEVSAYDIAVHPRDSKLVYLATEVGLFASGDGGDTWWPTNQGPANVAVNELFWMEEKLIAVTHGRGIFWIDLSQFGPAVAATKQFDTSIFSRGAAPPVFDNIRQNRTFVRPVSPTNTR